MTSQFTTNPTTNQVAPPDPSRPITVCFSDIVDSTSSWSSSEPTMHAAHAVLYSKIRSLALIHSGYEVKNLGDGLFLTFGSILKALKFCLQVQQELALVLWAPEVIAWRKKTDEDQGKPTHVGKGLTIRLGLHYGIPFSSHTDRVTDRMDYHGTMINLSVRVMGQAGEDEIGLTDAAIQALTDEIQLHTTGTRPARVSNLTDILRRLGLENQFVVERKGYTQLKGIQGRPHITLIRLRRSLGAGD